MIISTETMIKTEQKLDKLLCAAGERKRTAVLNDLSELAETHSRDVVDCVKWLLAYSPLSDIANYDFKLFVAFAEHGVFLRENSPFLKDVSEEIFLNFVLHTRCGGEEICDCRRFFYDKLIGRIKGLSMHDAIIEVNYWNAENVMYISTDYRTLNAIATYNSAFGRCGEESVFAINVFRSLGIPARQAMTPRWAHCDDNHAWVEVWEGGRWHFLGACEPEEVLDKGWFTNASGRAMMISTPCFGDISGAEIMYRSGLASVINILDTYAVTKKITVIVNDEDGKPVKGAKVLFGILNLCHIFPGAVLETDDSGKVSLTCGYGSINVRIKKNGIFFERMIYTPSADTFTFTLKPEKLAYDRWEDFTAIAPADGKPKGSKPTEEQKELCFRKTKAANRKREERVKAMFDCARADEVIKKFGYGPKIREVIEGSRGHADKIYEFLGNEQFTPEQKESILLVLSEKDWRDVDIDVLIEALKTSENKVGDKELFYECVANPRVWHEPLSLCREFIRNFFSDEQKKEFISDPKKIWEYVLAFDFDPSLEYGNSVTRPAGALIVRKCSPISKKILFVSICRALNIPARLNPVSLLAEYYDGGFIAVEKPEESGDSTIIFVKDDEDYMYLADFGVGMLENGNYQTLELGGEEWNGNTMTVKVKSGEYRVITDNRLPNGNLYASKYHFKLDKGETKTIKLRKYQADLADMLFEYKVDDFKVEREDGSDERGSELGGVMMWLDEGTEPTEHILNEMLDSKSEFASLPMGITFMVKSKEALKNAKLKKVLDTFPNIKVRYDSFDPNVETLARRLFLDPEKLPLIVIFGEPLKAVYACSGYNVGSGKMIIKICRYLNTQRKR